MSIIGGPESAAHTGEAPSMITSSGSTKANGFMAVRFIDSHGTQKKKRSTSIQKAPDV